MHNTFEALQSWLHFFYKLSTVFWTIKKGFVLKQLLVTVLHIIINVKDKGKPLLKGILCCNIQTQLKWNKQVQEWLY